MRSISSSRIPSRRPIPTCWPHSYGDRQRHPARRIASSRSRPESVDFSEHVVGEHQPPLHQLRMLRHRAEHVEHLDVVAPEGGERRRAARGSRARRRRARPAGCEESSRQPTVTPWRRLSTTSSVCSTRTRRRSGSRSTGPPAVERVSMEVAPGQRLSALRWGTEPPELVLLHGGGQNAHTWDTVALALRTPARSRSTFPGHGHSDWRDDHAYCPAENARAVAVMIRELAPDAAAVVGMSLGGLTALVARLGSARARAPARARRRHARRRPRQGVGRDRLHRGTRVVRELRRDPRPHGRVQPDAFGLVAAARHPAQRGRAAGRHVGVALRAVRHPRRHGDARLRRPLGRTSTRSTCRCSSCAAPTPPSSATTTSPSCARRRPAARVVVVDGAGHSVQGDQPLELAALHRRVRPRRVTLTCATLRGRSDSTLPADLSTFAWAVRRGPWVTVRTIRRTSPDGRCGEWSAPVDPAIIGMGSWAHAPHRAAWLRVAPASPARATATLFAFGSLLTLVDALLTRTLLQRHAPDRAMGPGARCSWTRSGSTSRSRSARCSRSSRWRSSRGARCGRASTLASLSFVVLCARGRGPGVRAA